MPQVVITIDVPAGTEVSVEQTDADGGSPAAVPGPPVSDEKAIAEYWNNYLSETLREMYSVMATFELSSDENRFTHDEVAKVIGVKREKVRAWVRIAGKPKHRWKREKGTPEPVKLLDLGRVPGRDIHWYSFEPGVAEVINNLS